MEEYMERRVELLVDKGKYRFYWVEHCKQTIEAIVDKLASPMAYGHYMGTIEVSLGFGMIRRGVTISSGPLILSNMSIYGVVWNQ